MAAHRPEKGLALLEAGEFLRREDAGLDEVLAAVDAIEIFGDPVERLQVAQAALAVLDIGLDQVARGARRGVAGVALGELGVDEFGARCLDQSSAEAG